MLNAGYCNGSVRCDWCAQNDHPHFDLDNESFNTVTLYTFVLACLLCCAVLCGVVPLDVRLSRSSFVLFLLKDEKATIFTTTTLITRIKFKWLLHNPAG